MAVDQGEPLRMTYASVVITLLDVNDVAPVFNVISYMSVMENAQVGAVMGTFVAIDPDTGRGECFNFCVINHTSIIDSCMIYKR
jgi:hypothetical protein